MPPIRASDAEREAAASRLRTAAGEGRLEPDELEVRLEAALSARTRAELVPLVADLPRRRMRRPPLPGRLAAYAAGNAALIALWMGDVGARDPWVVGNSDFFWPIVPIAATVAVVLRRRRPA
jgi:DUF1707 SHOCT-like domain